MFNGRKYLESTDFKTTDVNPTINPSKPRFYSEVKNIDGVDISIDYINMIKPLAPLDFTKNISQRKIFK